MLPCPFCGGEARIKSRYIGYGSVGLGARDWYTVECNECRAKSDEYGAELEAIVAWNRRADAVPVVRGEWIEKTYIHEYANEETEERQYVVCSICGKQPPSGFGAVNFCHNCGADMRRESEGST